MPSLKDYFNRRLTTLETMVVITVAGIVAALGYLGYQFTTAKLLEWRVNAALPKVCEGIRDQRGKLVSAIEAYKVQFGVYPPDHVVNHQPLVVDPVTNTLFYELVGVIYNPTNKMYQVGGLEPAEEKYVKDFFHVDGFKNCAQTPDKITSFLNKNQLLALQLHDDPDVFAAGCQVPSDVVDLGVFWEFQISSWRYVSSSPTNNSGKFDLWIEVKTKTQKVVIGNWKAVE